MKALTCLMVMASALVITACNAVFTRQPMGAETVLLEETKWQGTWLGDEIVLVTTVLDAGKGLLQAAWVERGPEGARFESYSGTVRRTGDWMYLTMAHEPGKSGQSGDQPADPPGPEVAADTEYFWARVENNGQRVFLWLPSPESFKLAVSEARLPGTIDEDDVLLGQLDQAQIELINSPAENLLQWSEPLVFIRIGE